MKQVFKGKDAHSLVRIRNTLATHQQHIRNTLATRQQHISNTFQHSAQPKNSKALATSCAFLLVCVIFLFYFFNFFLYQEWFKAETHTSEHSACLSICFFNLFFNLFLWTKRVKQNLSGGVCVKGIKQGFRVYALKKKVIIVTNLPRGVPYLEPHRFPAN